MTTKNVTSVLLLLALAGCSGGNSAGPASESSEGASNAALAPSVATTPTQSVKTTPTSLPSPTPGAIRCETGRMSVRVVRRAGETAGVVHGLLMLVNTGVGTCALTGWATFALTDAGHQTKVTAKHLSQPTAPVAISLASGESAFAGLQWTPCQPAAAGCSSGAQLLVAMPGSTLVPATLSRFSLAERKQLTMKSMVVGSIQPNLTGLEDSW
jgi:hypothetical protein